MRAPKSRNITSASYVFSYCKSGVNGTLVRATYVAFLLLSVQIYYSKNVQAETYRVSVGEVPTTPMLLGLLKSIEAANPWLKFEITVAPFPRSIRAVAEDHTADLHFPLIRPVDEAGLPFDVSTTQVGETPFMLYENKSKPLDIRRLGEYKIETDFAHTGVFPFNTIGSGDISASLRKVDAGRIDGFIFDEFSSDQHLIADGYKNIHRKFYALMDACFILPKGGKGGPADQALTRAIEAARHTQGYKDAVAKYDVKGVDWQQ